MKVSVIIPNYNHAPFLRQRINAVLTQTYTNIEIIILDDCSTDHSREIINEFAHEPAITHIIYGQVNSGNVFSQWAKGISYCKGEWVWIAESDDWCEPNFLASMLDGVKADKEAVLAYCQSYCIQSENTIAWKSSEDLLNQQMPGNTFIISRMLTTNSLFNASMAVWKRTAFDKVSADFATYNYCGDWLFWIGIARQGNVFVSGRLLNYFRRHDTHHSLKSLQGDKFLEEIRLFNYLRHNAWIDYAEFIAAIRASYLRFKGQKNHLTTKSYSEIEKEFLRQPVKSSELTGYYIKHYATSQLKRFLKAAFNRN